MFQMEMSVTLVKFVKSYNVLGASIFFSFFGVLVHSIGI